GWSSENDPRARGCRKGPWQRTGSDSDQVRNQPVSWRRCMERKKLDSGRQRLGKQPNRGSLYWKVRGPALEKLSTGYRKPWRADCPQQDTFLCSVRPEVGPNP